MNPNDQIARVFPLDAPATRQEIFRAARLASALNPSPGSIMMGNCAFIRSWAERRLKASMNLTPQRRELT